MSQIFILNKTKPKANNDYSQGKIYALMTSNLIYIGCTIQELDERFKEHERSYKKGANKQCTSCQ